MANEYIIELTDGTSLATIEALEVDGGTSTGRNILVVDTTGGAGTNFFEISGDLTARYVAGFTFDVVGSATNDATYTVVGAGSSFVGGNTRIQVNQAITDDDSVLPLGSTFYDLLDIGGTNTRSAPVELPGRGVVNYGEFILEDLLHMTEHFASAEGAPGIPDFTLVPNRLEAPLVGQLWYNRTNESLYRFTGPDPAVDWALGAAMGICDADNDTCVLTEEAPDEDVIRFDTGDTPIGYPSVTDIMTLASSGWNVSMGAANVPTTVGAPISLTAGTGGLTSAGGVLNLTAGAGGATSGAGGFVNISAGAAQTSGNGGDINQIGRASCRERV